MDRNTSIFYKMTNENENSTTELFCNILRNKYIRDIVLKYFDIPLDMLDEITQDNINTQNQNKESGIPDITIESDNCFYIIENKIELGTKLTEKQKSSYIKLINSKNKKYRGYIFLIPSDYKDETSINNIKKQIKDDTNKIIVKTWKEFLEYLNKMEVCNDSPILKESIDYLTHIVLEAPIDNTLSNEEINMFYNPKNIYLTLCLLNKYFEIIDQNESMFLKDLGKDFSAGNWEKNFENTKLKGKYLKYKNSPCIFYGFIFNLLNPVDDNYNKYIFSICFNRDYLNKNLTINKKYCSIEDKNWLYIKTDISNIISDKTGKKYFDELKNIIFEIFPKK